MSVAAAISTDPSPYIVGQVYDIDPAVLTAHHNRGCRCGVIVVGASVTG